MDFESETFVAHTLRGEGFDASEDGTGRGIPLVTPCLTGNYGKQPDNSDTNSGPMVIPCLRSGNIYNNSDPGMEAKMLIAVAFHPKASRTQSMNPSEVCPTIGTTKEPAVAFTERGRDKGRTFEYQEETAYCLTNPGSGGRTHSRQIAQGAAVRRLTPRECERLQGFEDDFTLILWRGRPPEDCPDGPRYRALGNSMAVPVMRWIGKRIDEVEGMA